MRIRREQEGGVTKMIMAEEVNIRGYLPNLITTCHLYKGKNILGGSTQYFENNVVFILLYATLER